MEICKNNSYVMQQYMKLYCFWEDKLNVYCVWHVKDY